MVIRALAPILSVGLLGVIAFEHQQRRDAADATPFHAAAQAAIKGVPVRLGAWDTTELPIPEAAVSLLRPNALLARRCTDATTGESAILLIVQCADARDMAGHYPPICYPAQGWKSSQPVRVVNLNVGGQTMTAVRYEFARESFDRDRSIVIFGFFAVPGGGLIADMPGIRQIASDYTSRPFGAAQIHIVLDGRVQPEREQPIAEELLGHVRTVIDTLADPSWRKR